MSGVIARARALDVADQLTGLGAVTVGRFFGGAALLIEGLQFAFVIKGSLYLRVDAETRPEFEARGAEPFRYTGRSGLVTVASYYEAPDDIAEDTEALRRWAARAHRAACLAAAKKPRRTLKRPPAGLG